MFEKYYKYCIFFVIILFSGCAMPRTLNFDDKLFDENLNKWKSLNKSNYQLIYQSIGYSTYSIKIVVKNNFVSTFSVVGENSPYDEQSLKGEAKTINGFFDKILDFYNKENGKKCSDYEMYYTDLVVFYNKDYGYPENWYYKYYCPENFAVDGNFSFRITDFDLTSDQ